jgi:hypothetical protein
VCSCVSSVPTFPMTLPSGERPLPLKIYAIALNQPLTGNLLRAMLAFDSLISIRLIQID